MKCLCKEHQGKEMLNQVFALDVNQIFECIFGHTAFCRKYWESRNFGEIRVGEWKLVANSPQRTLEYTVDLGAMGKPKNTEEQVFIFFFLSLYFFFLGRGSNADYGLCGYRKKKKNKRIRVKKLQKSRKTWKTDFFYKKSTETD
jgi:hypothetical protein